MSRHTIRGEVLAGASEKLILDDGIFTEGHRVKSFTIIGANNGSIESKCVLSYGDSVTGIAFSDGNQFGWSIWDTDTTNGVRHFSLVDPDHVILQDMFITSLSGAASFLVEIEPITLTEAQGVLQLVKAKRQA